jgi:hypothetical protein
MNKFLLVAALSAVCKLADAQFFNQTFSSSGSVPFYVNATPNSGQFTFIGSTGGGSASINTGALRMQRSANNGNVAACRNYDFQGDPETMAFAFDFSATGNPHSNQNAVIIQMGEGFSNNTTPEANANVYAQFGISFPGSAQNFRISNITANHHHATSFSGTQRITWILNRKGTSINYTGPNNASVSLGSNRADIWVGTTRVYNNVNIQTSSKRMLNFKIIFNPNQNCHVHFDNFGTLTANNSLPEGSYTVGVGSDFPSLTNNGGLFQALNNAGMLEGNYFFRIESNLTNETGTHRLNFLTGMDQHNIIISPKNATNYIITSASNTNVGGMIFLNGARNVIIDGRAPGDLTENENTQRYLTFRNQHTNGPSLTLQNGASNNVVRFCNIEGRTSSTAHGVVFLGPSANGFAPSNGNLLAYNHIRNSNATPRHLIFMNGTANAVNRNNVIEKNHIYNAFIASNSSQALVVQNHSKQISINANHFYQTVALAYGNSATYISIIGAGRIGGASTNVDSLYITNNFIGGAAPSCGGQAWLLAVNSNMPMRIRAIDLRIPSDAYALVQGNTIDNIQMNFNRTTNSNEYSFRGIFVNSGKVEVLDNNIGSTDKMKFHSWANNSAGYIPLIGIEYNGTGRQVSGNVIKGIKSDASAGTLGFDKVGIYTSYTGDSLFIRNNTVGSLTDNESFRINNSSTNSFLRGILNLTSGINRFVAIENNTIAGLSNMSSGNQASCSGVVAGSSSNLIIDNNIISMLSANSSAQYTAANAVALSGIFLQSSARRSEISNNQVNSIENVNWGNLSSITQAIYAQGSDTILIFNNRIYGLNNNSTSTSTSAPGVNAGIRLGNSSATGITVYNNMISLGNLLNGSNNDKPVPYVGIWDASDAATSKSRIFYNSVVISGNTWGNSMQGFALLKGLYDETPSPGLFQAANNILTNRRSGNACNAAIGYPNASSNKNLINNNILFSAVATRTAMNGMGIYLGFSDWQSSGADSFSSFENIAQPSALTSCGTASFANLQQADLRLPPCEVRISSKGMIPQAPVSMLYDIDGDFRRGTDIGADEVENVFTFTGTVSTDWHTPNNWDLKFVPSCADSVIIANNGAVVATPAGNITVQRQPSLATSQKAYFRSIHIRNNATLTLANQSLIQGCWFDGVVNIQGTLTNNGSRFEMAGNLLLNGNMNNTAGSITFNLDEVDQFGNNPGLNDFIKLYNLPHNEIQIDGNSHLHANAYEIINGGRVHFNGPSTRLFSAKISGSNLMDHGSVFYMHGKTITINGNMRSGTGYFAGDDQARLIVNGNDTWGCELRFIEGARLLKTLEINRNNGHIILGSELSVTDTLKLVKGHLETTEQHLLILPLSNKIVGVVNDQNCVYGPVKKIMASTAKFTFPIGRAGTYRPASVIPTSSSEVAFTASYFNQSAHNPYDLTSKSPEFEYISDKEYWIINREGSINAQVELTWNTASQINATHMGLARLQVMRWDSDDLMWLTTGPNLGDASGTNDAGIIRSDMIQNFSPFTFGVYDMDALPVELLSFTAEPSGEDVLLKWVTASETNNDYFSVLRSTNASDFVEIGTVNGAGTSNSIRNYAFDDAFAARLNIPVIYYRLRQVDFNGDSELSEIAPVKFTSDGNFQIVHASFMPGTNTIEGIYTAGENAAVEVFCFDINGRLMGQMRSNARKGTNRIELNLNGQLPSGIYTMQIIMLNQAVAVKIPKADR